MNLRNKTLPSVAVGDHTASVRGRVRNKTLSLSDLPPDTTTQAQASAAALGYIASQQEFWCPDPFWAGKTAFIVGGGPSLQGVDLDWLADKEAIGANDAYTLGPDLVDIAYFSDLNWWKIHWQQHVAYKDLSIKADHPGLKAFDNEIVTCCPNWMEIAPYAPRIRILCPRESNTLCAKFPAVGWFGNTGMSAINLALLLGATTVVLVGFDMKPTEDRETNWYPNLKNRIHKISKDHMDTKFEEFRLRAAWLFKQLPLRFPHATILNANPDSALEGADKITLEEAKRL